MPGSLNSSMTLFWMPAYCMQEDGFGLVSNYPPSGRAKAGVDARYRIDDI
jgi:hypothetical protein